jgi:hypothetical protein
MEKITKHQSEEFFFLCALRRVFFGEIRRKTHSREKLGGSHHFNQPKDEEEEKIGVFLFLLSCC